MYCSSSGFFRLLPKHILAINNNSKISRIVSSSLQNHSTMSTPNFDHQQEEIATFGAGCFWGVELNFQRIPGVISTLVGYCNGETLHPTYKQVCSGKTGHVEAVQLKYNPKEVSYNCLLDTFWKIHDPTTLNRQKNDVGTQYRSGIYYTTEEQRDLAIASKKEAEKRFSSIATEIEKASTFYPAEDYHQKYLEKGGQCAAKNCADKIRCYG